MDVGPYYLGSFSQVSHLMENTHHRVKKKKNLQVRNPREKTPVAASDNVSPGEEPRQPSPYLPPHKARPRCSAAPQ